MNYDSAPQLAVTAHCGLDLNSFRTILWSGKTLVTLCFVDTTRQCTVGWLKAGTTCHEMETQELLTRVYSIQNLL